MPVKLSTKVFSIMSPRDYMNICRHSGKSATIKESNHGSGVCKEHYA